MKMQSRYFLAATIENLHCKNASRASSVEPASHPRVTSHAQANKDDVNVSPVISKQCTMQKGQRYSLSQVLDAMGDRMISPIKSQHDLVHVQGASPSLSDIASLRYHSHLSGRSRRSFPIER